MGKPVGEGGKGVAGSKGKGSDATSLVPDAIENGKGVVGGKGKKNGMPPPPPPRGGKGVPPPSPCIEFDAEIGHVGSYYGCGLVCLWRPKEIVSIIDMSAVYTYNQRLSPQDVQRIQPGDVLVEVDGRDVAHMEDWRYAIRSDGQPSVLKIRRERRSIRMVALREEGNAILGLSLSGDEVFSVDSRISQAGELRNTIAAATNADEVLLIRGDHPMLDDEILGDVASIVARVHLKNRTWTWSCKPAVMEPEVQEVAQGVLDTGEICFRTARTTVGARLSAQHAKLGSLARRVNPFSPHVNGTCSTEEDLADGTWCKENGAWHVVDGCTPQTQAEALLDENPIAFHTAMHHLAAFYNGSPQKFKLKRPKTSEEAATLFESVAQLEASPHHIVDNEAAATAACNVLEALTHTKPGDVETRYRAAAAVLFSADWSTDKALEARVRFLPAELRLERILVQQESNQWLLTKSRQAAMKGICFRRSKSNDDVVDTEIQLWGSLIYGSGEGDGWVRFDMQLLRQRVLRRALSTLAWCASHGHEKSILGIHSLLLISKQSQHTDARAREIEIMSGRLIAAIPDKDSLLIPQLLKAIRSGHEMLNALQRLSGLNCIEDVQIHDALRTLLTQLAPPTMNRFCLVTNNDGQWKSDPLLVSEVERMGMTMDEVEPKLHMVVIGMDGYPLSHEMHADPVATRLRISYPICVAEEGRRATDWQYLAPFLVAALRRFSVDVGDAGLAALCHLSSGGFAESRRLALYALAELAPRGHRDTLTALCSCAAADDATVRTQTLDVLLTLIRPEDMDFIRARLENRDPHAHQIWQRVLEKHAQEKVSCKHDVVF
jgi:hypothetical protein